MQRLTVGAFAMQPWITADEVNEAIESVLAASMGPDGSPATLDNIYLRQVRDVRLSTTFLWLAHANMLCSLMLKAHTYISLWQPFMQLVYRRTLPLGRKGVSSS
jgi:hypothetical protein